MASRRTPPRCACGCAYDELKTGLSFADVRRMLRDQPDPSRPGWFRQKRRRSVLGYWRELKLQLWSVVHGYCEEALRDAA